MRNTLITILHEGNKHKKTIATWEALERLSASIECLMLDDEQHDIFIETVKAVIETIESASFTKGKMIAERDYNEDIRRLVRNLDDPNLKSLVEGRITESYN